MSAYAEPVAATNFSFLSGASAADELVLMSLALGQTGLGIADRNTVAGVVRAFAALAELREEGALPPVKLREGSGPGEYFYAPRQTSPMGAPRPAGSTGEPEPALRALIQARARAFKLVTGARLGFADGTPDIVAYPQNRAGWGRLCRLLTLGNRRAKKGDCHLELDDLIAHAGDLLLIVMPERASAALAALLRRLAEAAPGAVWLAATMPRHGADRRRLAGLMTAARRAGVPLIATNDVLYADPGCRDLQDLLTCIRDGVTIAEAGRRLEANAERHLKPPTEMLRLFADCPEAIAETQALLARIDFSLDQLQYEYPDEVVPPGHTPQGWLSELTWRYARLRYPAGLPAKVEQLLIDELALIGKLGYARYFLTIHDIVRVANDKGILCQGRGSAANSASCNSE